MTVRLPTEEEKKRAELMAQGIWTGPVKAAPADKRQRMIEALRKKKSGQESS